jgi:hypothetical protein
MNAVHFTLLTLTGLVVLLPAAPAAGQDALGTGTALDAGLSTRGSMNLPLPREDFRARNLIVTDNVIGGRGFRGSVGYTAANDFRGDIGSDDFYGFRRDSAWTDVTFLNYGATYQQLRFGQSMGLLELRRDFYGSSGQTLGERPQLAGQKSLTPAGELRLHDIDLINTEMQLDQVSFSSSTSMTTRRAAEPINIGITRDEEGSEYFITASSLTGLEVKPVVQDHQLLGLGTYDVARVRDDIMAQRDLRRLGAPFEAKYEDLLAVDRSEDTRVGGPIESGTLDSRIDLQSEPEFRQILERVASRYAAEKQAEEGTGAETQADVPVPTPGEAGIGSELSDPQLYKELDEDLRRIREYLADRVRPGEETAETRPGFTSTEIEPQEPRGAEDPLNRLERPGPITSPGQPDISEFQTPTPPPLLGAEDEEAMPKPLEVPLEVKVEELGTILRHGERVEAFTSKDQNRFNELLAGAEEKLRAGEYFWAERRFNRALRFTPGHPLATAGLAHAQIGAGLYLSASLTLQSLFRFQPEMIDTEYDEGLVPSRIRLLQARDELTGRLDETRDLVSNAFLLAYIGRLLHDRAVIEQGLAAMEDAEPDNHLLTLLKAIWLADDDEPPTGGDAAAPARTVEPEK